MESANFGRDYRRVIPTAQATSAVDNQQIARIFSNIVSGGIAASPFLLLLYWE